MRVTTRGRVARAPVDCDAWEQEPTTGTVDVLASERADVYSVVVRDAGSRQSAEAAFETAVALLLAYRVFPPDRMEPTVCTDDGRVALGATIVQRISVGPVGLESAVRVVELIDEREPDGERVGFAYVTLRGHPERGAERMEVVRDRGRVELRTRASSRPGGRLVGMGRFVTRRLQVRWTRDALEHFRSLVCGDPNEAASSRGRRGQGPGR